MKIHCFLLSVCIVTSLKGVLLGGPVHNPSLEERMVYSQWSEGSYKATIVPLPLSTDKRYITKCFTVDKQFIIVNFQDNCERLRPLYQYYVSFDIKNKIWNDIPGQEFSVEYQKPKHSIIFYRDLFNAIVSRMLKALPQETREEIRDKHHGHLFLTTSNDYHAFFSMFSSTEMIILELHTKKLPIQKMIKLNDVQFSFV